MGKEITIKGYDMFQTYQHATDFGKDMRVIGFDSMQVSDGSHTMDELYEHRITLFIKLCEILFGYSSAKHEVWKSEFHSDGTRYDDWFILGINKKKGEQITYHLPMIKWNACDFAETLENAPEWDGHSSSDVLERISKI